MKHKRLLALLCMLSLCCINAFTIVPSLADNVDDSHASAQAQTEVVSNGKKKKKDSKATKKPKKTKKPKATKTPKPVVTPKPDKTPKPTKKPKKTQEPEETKEPEKTKKPKKTQEPEETKEPEKTKKPKKTEAPEETKEPDKTKKPKKTEAPEETKEPDKTKKPKKTEAPEETEAGQEPETPKDEQEPEAPQEEKEPETPKEEQEPEAPQEPEGGGEPEEPKGEQQPEEPKATETPAPTKAPKLKLKGLKSDKKEVAPGKKVKFTVTAENAETVTWSAIRSDGQSGGYGEVKKGKFSWKPEVSGVYTVTVTATAGDKTASDSCQLIVRQSRLAVEAVVADEYAQQGGKKLKFDIVITGGCEPYTMDTVVKYKDDIIFASNEVLDKVRCDAVGYGKNKLTVTVIDAAGDKIKAKATIVSASNAPNEAPPLPKLKGGMTFAEKLIAVAKSQQGYRESKENFILRDDGSVQGWSYYGGWYGAPYDEWCAMFVSYCLVNAGIGEEYMPHSGNCNRWKGDLGTRYIDDEDNYYPEPGDIIFFHHNRVSNDPNYPNHIGIVTGYDAGKDIVYTVEGNSGKSVRARQYEHGSSVIVGYASMRECMVQYDGVYREKLGDRLAVNLENFRAQYAGKD